MAIRYSKEVHEFIAEHVEGLTCKELTELTNREMGTSFSVEQMKAYKHNHKLKSGTKGGNPKGYSPIYPENMCDFVRSIAKGLNTKEIAEAVNKHYGRELITESKIRSYMKNRGIRNGVDMRFKKGQVSLNKGRKQTEFMSPEGIERTKAARFQKGHSPKNELPIGTISKTKNGYLIRKKQMQGKRWERWELLHRAVWEEHYGPIPEGMQVSFKNGNKEDVRIENLMLISNAENLQMQRSKLRSADPELTEIGLSVAKLQIKIHEKKRGKRG